MAFDEWDTRHGPYNALWRVRPHRHRLTYIAHLDGFTGVSIVNPSLAPNTAIGTEYSHAGLSRYGAVDFPLLIIIMFHPEYLFVVVIGVQQSMAGHVSTLSYHSLVNPNSNNAARCAATKVEGTSSGLVPNTRNRAIKTRSSAVVTFRHRSMIWSLSCTRVVAYAIADTPRIAL